MSKWQRMRHTLRYTRRVIALQALALGNFSDRLFNEQKGARRSILICFGILGLWVSYVLFSRPESISSSVAAAYAALTSLLATVFGFYNYSRNAADARAVRRSLHEARDEEDLPSGKAFDSDDDQ